MIQRADFHYKINEWLHIFSRYLSACLDLSCYEIDSNTNIMLMIIFNLHDAGLVMVKYKNKHIDKLHCTCCMSQKWHK